MDEPPPGLMRGLADRILWRMSPYWFAAAKLRYRLRERPGGDPLVVHTVGKVGSTSIAATLERRLPDRPIEHVHWLMEPHLREDEQLHRRRAAAYRGSPRARRFHPEYVWRGQRLRRSLERDAGKTWEVVTLVRDPVARNVSSFFQNLALLHDVWLADELARDSPERLAARLIEPFLDSYVHRGPSFGLDGDPLTWFESEMAPVFGVDVYATPFPRERGWNVYRSDRARVLLLRLESVDRAAEPAFEAFLGVRGARVLRRNEATGKAHRDVYQAFQRQLTLPASYLDSVYGHRYSRHFYDDHELSAFRARWSTPSGSAPA